MPLEYVISIEEGLFTVRFDPNLVFAVLRQIVQTCNIELKLARACEFAENGSCREQFVFSDVCRHFENLAVDVVDSARVETKDPLTVLPVHKEFDVGAEKLCQLLEELGSFLL
jgi:hypothetical protein